MSAKLNTITGQTEPEIPITDARNKFYTEYNGKDNKRSAPPYTIEVFEDIGRAFCIGVLDFYECNPITRLPLSVFKNLEGVKNDLLARYPIFIPKKEQPEVNVKPKPKPLIRQKTANTVQLLVSEGVRSNKTSEATTN